MASNHGCWLMCTLPCCACCKWILKKLMPLVPFRLATRPSPPSQPLTPTPPLCIHALQSLSHAFHGTPQLPHSTKCILLGDCVTFANQISSAGPTNTAVGVLVKQYRYGHCGLQQALKSALEPDRHQFGQTFFIMAVHQNVGDSVLLSPCQHHVVQTRILPIHLCFQGLVHSASASL